MKKNKTRKKLPFMVKIILPILLAFLLVVGGYLSYVFIAYDRLDDMLPLDIANNGESSVPVNAELSIVTWNIGFGAYSDDYSFFMDGGKYSRAFSEDAAITNVSAAAELLGLRCADFIFVQEVDTDSTRSYHVNEADILLSYLGNYASTFAQNYDSPYLFYPFTSPHGKSVAGVMTFSSYRVESAVRRSLPIEQGFSKFLDLDRCYSVLKIPTENEKYLCLYNLHLSAYTTDGTIATEQLVMLINDMEKEYQSGNYVIAGGDFNKDLLGNSGEIFGVAGDDYTWAQPIPDGTIPDWLSLVACSNAPSCRNADRPYDETNFVLTVDGFLVSENVEIITAEVLDEAFAHSDHNPVTMTFLLKS